jgi:PIN domain nuclease of toxin-antitoxin system
MMHILFDTHLLLWALADLPRLPERARSAFNDPTNTLLFSAASIWEIAIKSSLGRLELAVHPLEVAKEAIRVGFSELVISSETASAVGDLPMHHRDPFDRLLIAQALRIPAHLYTVDRKLAPYSELIVSL